jgi:hypothetical protein
LKKSLGTKAVPAPSKELAEKEIRAAAAIGKLAQTWNFTGWNSGRRAILLKFVRLAHNSVTTPTAVIWRPRTGGRLEDNLAWQLMTSTTT